MHACLGIPQLEVGCTWGKHAEKLMKNYTYMHACMHAGASLSWNRLHLTKECWKIKEKLNMYACMQAGASLSWRRLHLM